MNGRIERKRKGTNTGSYFLDVGRCLINSVGKKKEKSGLRDPHYERSSKIVSRELA